MKGLGVAANGATEEVSHFRKHYAGSPPSMDVRESRFSGGTGG